MTSQDNQWRREANSVAVESLTLISFLPDTVTFNTITVSG